MTALPLLKMNKLEVKIHSKYEIGEKLDFEETANSSVISVFKLSSWLSAIVFLVLNYETGRSN